VIKGANLLKSGEGVVREDKKEVRLKIANKVFALNIKMELVFK
jgi:hypothetical protein